MIHKGNNGKQNQTISCWNKTIWNKFKLLDITIIGKIINDIDTSYEIAWATLRIAAKKAYFELLAQPANKIPYIPNADTISIYKILIFKFITKDFVLKGITAQPIKLKYSVKKGAKRNKNLLALFGITISFTISFSASAKGWSTPQKPVIFGPLRRWIAPITLRSANVKSATEMIKKIKVNNVKTNKTQ